MGPLDDVLAILGNGAPSGAAPPAPVGGNVAASAYLNDPKNRPAVMADASRIAALRPGSAASAVPAQQASGPLGGVIGLLSGAGPTAAATAAPPTPALPQTINGKPWQAPGGIMMGVGDSLKGALETGLHGVGWVADKVAPDSGFAKDIHAGIDQLAQTSSAQEAAYQEKRSAQGQSGFDVARTTGNVVGAAPMLALAPEFGGAGMGGVAMRGALSGAENALITPVSDPTGNYASQKAQQLGVSALAGGVAAPVTNLLTRAIAPNIGAAQQRLMGAGVPLTPGQILGGGAARTEEKLTSVPILGDVIKNAQQRSIQGFNRAVYNDALSPIGTTLPKSVATGSDAVGAVNKAIGDVYKSIEPKAQFVPDQNFSGDLQAIRQNLEQNAPGVLAQFDNIVKNQVADKAAASGGVLSGAQWGQTRSAISGIARNQVLGNASPDNRILAEALGDLNQAINTGVGRSSPPEVLPTLEKANAAWARYKQLESAAGMAGASNNGNVFTAAQYANAVRKGSTSSQRAQNSGLNGDLAADAQSVLGSKYPDSGTPGRALLAMMGPAALGQMAAPQAMLPAAAGIGLASVPYTELGGRIARAALTRRPAAAQPIANMLTRYLAPAAPVFAPSLVNAKNK